MQEKTERADEGELDDLFPNVGHFAQTQDEYIRTLEKALQLLQREVEHLREQRRPEPSAHLQASKSAEEPIGLFQHAATAEEAMSALREYVSEKLPGSESMLYYRTMQHALSPASDFIAPDLERAVRYYDEQGIIDWIFNEKLTKILPDLSAPKENAKVLLAPLFLRGADAGVFAASINAESETPESNISAIARLAEAALVALDNIRSAAEIGQMNKKLADLNRQMLQSSKLASIGELAGSVAHEINSPLQILLAHLQLLETGVGNPERRLEIIKQQVRRISEITRRLLDFARNSPVETGIEKVDAKQIIDEVLLFVSSQLNRDGIHVACEIDDPSPVIAGSKAHLEQVLLNLVLNSRDAMPDGGNIVIGAYSTNDNKTLITIADTGAGISEENLPRIFEPFFTTKRRGKGTGLGLSITKTIVEQHRGAIEVASEFGKGTTFKITLPACRTT